MHKQNTETLTYKQIRMLHIDPVHCRRKIMLQFRIPFSSRLPLLPIARPRASKGLRLHVFLQHGLLKLLLSHGLHLLLHLGPRGRDGILRSQLGLSLRLGDGFLVGATFLLGPGVLERGVEVVPPARTQEVSNQTHVLLDLSLMLLFLGVIFLLLLHSDNSVCCIFLFSDSIFLKEKTIPIETNNTK
jgi:hypothetical protein